MPSLVLHYLTLLRALSRCRYRLLEATPGVLAALTGGEKVYLKGDNASELVVCTQSQTHKLLKVEHTAV